MVGEARLGRTSKNQRMKTSRSFVSPGGFTVLAEIEPATRPDIRGVREQIAVLAPVADAFLVPDNHLGRATVSSLAVAHEVAAMGGRSIACLNARDRNLLGLQRDLLTAAAYGVDHLLLVQGDRRADETPTLTASGMFKEARESAARMGMPHLSLGVTARAGKPLPAWKKEADFVLTQINYAVEDVVAWRESLSYDGPVLVGVIVLTSAEMAGRLAGGGYGVEIPDAVVERLAREPRCGVEMAIDLVGRFRTSCCDGVHLVSGNRYRDVAQALLLRAADADD
jgi:methylenetetrahydrofolate reductase (NADPH)